MTHRLQHSTRLVALATSGAAVVAAADVVDQHGLTTWALGVATLLVLAALLVARLQRVALEVDQDVVMVRNVLATHQVPRSDVAEIRPGSWRSVVILVDGSRLPTLLRDRDLDLDTEQAARADHTEHAPPALVAAR